jgi:hypothetical protein
VNPSGATYDNAVKIIAKTMRPWRPAALYRAAFVPMPGHEAPGHRESERFRERLALRRPEIIKRGPWFALKRWLEPVLPIVSWNDLIVIPLSGECIRAANWDTIKRIDHMKVRNPAASKATRITAALNGKAIEQHVKYFFKTQWPKSFLPASNDGFYRKPAPDDFSLILADRRFTVDVAQSDQKFPPRWRLHENKMLGARLRIIAFFNELGIIMQGYTWKNNNGFELWPLERLIVRLNIQELKGCFQHFEDCFIY